MVSCAKPRHARRSGCVNAEFGATAGDLWLCLCVALADISEKNLSLALRKRVESLGDSFAEVLGTRIARGITNGSTATESTKFSFERFTPKRSTTQNNGDRKARGKQTHTQFHVRRGARGSAGCTVRQSHAGGVVSRFRRLSSPRDSCALCSEGAIFFHGFGNDLVANAPGDSASRRLVARNALQNGVINTAEVGQKKQRARAIS